jgi:hypothetical protein
MAASVAPELMPTRMPSSRAQRRAFPCVGRIDLDDAVELVGMKIFRDEAGADALDRCGRAGRRR